MKHTMTVWGALALIACSQAAPIHAAELEGRKAINLVSSAGEKLVIGHVDFSPKEGGYAFKLAFAREAFREIYMQETNFLCLSDARKDVCHFPYPPGDYASDDSSGLISESDLRALEHALLFAEKRRAPEEIDINPFNGLYYRLQLIDKHIGGTLFAVDLSRTIDMEGGTKYPIGPNNLEPVNLQYQRFPRLVIE
ncbi:hypothetical protein GJQ57_22560 [Ralstonia pickettii]|uniref:DUF2259 domain-containing protein n=2 Tax=Ralstonia TaxID=48736 RepID=A0AAD2C2B7_9RALS|nr:MULTISPECIES: hypothetical protein [Ralstonia]MRT01437.1 hypothetical protein [Ralstonia pickettii]CAJ0884751.1 hypothetical protein R77567_03695 [Ralstonia sp. LMG 32965]CAJ0901121.1 hypothetical protein R77564_04532 [Ralstonia sp. LMG 32965]